jgi:ankyrin repeat protein
VFGHALKHHYLELFEANLTRAIYESRIMDMINSNKILEHGKPPFRHGGEKFVHSYLTYRVSGKKGNPLRAIHEIAIVICSETDKSMTTVIDELCWLALSRGFSTVGKSEFAKPLAEQRQLLLPAAAYYNLIPLARRLLSEGCDNPRYPSRWYHLFPDPIHIAAVSGHAEMLDLLLDHCYALVDEHEYHRLALWRLNGPACRGDIEQLKVELRHGLYESSSSESINNKKDIVHSSIESADVWGAMSHATTPEAYRFLYEILEQCFPEDPIPRSLLGQHLAVNARYGNTAIVKILLDLGADIYHALLRACEKGHVSVVDLLLNHGADPNVCEGNPSSNTPLGLAAKRGSTPIVRKLLDHGADPNYRGNRGIIHPLRMAFRMEDKALIQLLLDRGAESPGEDMMRICKRRGLESMVEMLQELGVPKV